MHPSYPAEETTILVVEEEELHRQLIREYLDRENFSLMEAKTFFHALSLCECGKFRIDLILLDMEMAKVDSMSCMLILQDLRPDIPILGMTESPESYFEDRRLWKANVGFITRTFSYFQLHQGIKVLLENVDFVQVGISQTGRFRPLPFQSYREENDTGR